MIRTAFKMTGARSSKPPNSFCLSAFKGFVINVMDTYWSLKVCTVFFCSVFWGLANAIFHQKLSRFKCSYNGLKLFRKLVNFLFISIATVVCWKVAGHALREWKKIRNSFPRILEFKPFSEIQFLLYWPLLFSQ